MTVPLSKTELANMAQDFIGEPPISSIDTPRSRSEQLYARHYDQCREDFLRNHTWNFADRVTTINRLRDAEADWEDVYQLPDDFLRFVSADGETDTEASRWYSIKGREVYFDGGGAETLVCRYISNVVDLSKWDSMARTALARKLAYNVCYAITKSNSTTERLRQEADEDLRRAKIVDGTENPPHRRHESIIARKRRFIGLSDPTKEYPLY